MFKDHEAEDEHEVKIIVEEVDEVVTTFRNRLQVKAENVLLS